MDAETMERLVIDRRLGELPPDTAQLLDAYLQSTPSADAMATEIESVIDLAGRALRPESPPHSLPALSIAKAVEQGRTHHRLGWTRPLALAASIVLAFLLGTRMTGGPSASTAQLDGEIAQVSHPAPTDNAEFWSVAKLVSDRAADRPSQNTRVKWGSPLFWPRLGEKL